MAAKSNKRVLVLEKEGSLGGVCVNTGTFPSKTLREAVLHLTGHLKRKVFEDDYCSTRDAEISMAKLQQRLHHVRQEEHAIISSQLKRHRIRIIRGHASFLDENRIRIEQLELGFSAQNKYQGAKPVVAGPDRGVCFSRVPTLLQVLF